MKHNKSSHRIAQLNPSTNTSTNKQLGKRSSLHPSVGSTQPCHTPERQNRGRSKTRTKNYDGQIKESGYRN